MSDDYKYDMQMKAEEIAEEEYGKDFYALSDDLQYKIFRRAELWYGDEMASRGDFLLDSMKEGRLR